jgi:hypothetical protein
MLVPSHQQAWQAAWAEEDREHPLLRGATGGMTTGLGFLMITPMAAAFWPLAVGIVVGSTAMGMLGVTQSESADVPLSAPDRTVIVEATKQLQPDRLFREAMEQALRRRTGSRCPSSLAHGGGIRHRRGDPLVRRPWDGLLVCHRRAGSAPGRAGHLRRFVQVACAPWTRAMALR